MPEEKQVCWYCGEEMSSIDGFYSDSFDTRVHFECITKELYTLATAIQKGKIAESPRDTEILWIAGDGFSEMS